MAKADRSDRDGVASSLSQLQAIEKSSSSAAEKVKRIADVLNVSHVLKVSSNEDKRALTNVNDAAVRYHAQGSLDWALRWALGMLAAPTMEGHDARASPVLWRLLTHLLHALPLAIVSRHLATYNFISILERVFDMLNSSYGSDKPTSNLLPLLSLSPHASQLLPNTSHDNNVLAAGASPRKRKRHEAEHTAASNKKQKTPAPIDHSTLDTLLVSILACTRHIFQLTSEDNVDRDAYAFQYMQSILRTDHSQAARILGKWMSVLAKLRATESPLAESSSTFDTPLALRIWSESLRFSTPKLDASSKIAAASLAAPDLEFTKECLEPISRLVSCIPDSSTGTAYDLRTLLERLIVQHAWLPAKAGFRTLSREISTATSHNRAYVTEYVLPILAPFCEDSTTEGDDNARSRQCKLVHKSQLVLLFELSVRSCSLATPKSKASAMAWLETVFIAIAACLGYPIEPEKSSSPEHVNLLSSLFTVLTKREARLSTGTIQSFASSYCSLQGKPDSQQWDLLFRITAMSANVFVSSSSGAAESDQASKISSLFFSGITSSPLSCYLVNHTRLDTLPHIGELAHDILHKAIVPVAKAYASSRALDQFIDQWHTQLKKVELLCSERGGSSRSVWQAEFLSGLVGELVGTSLSTSQTREVFDRFANSLRAILLRAGSTTDDYGPSARILVSLLCSLQSDSMQRQLNTQAWDLIEAILTFISQPARTNVGEALWQLLGTAHRSWFDIAESQDIVNTYNTASQSASAPLDILVTWLERHYMSKDSSMMKDYQYAVATAGSIVLDVSRRHVESDATVSVLVQLLTCVNKILNMESDREHDVGARNALICAVAKHTILISYRNIPQLRDLYRDILSTIFRLMGRNETPEAKITPVWNFILEQACTLDGTISLREDVIWTLGMIVEHAMKTSGSGQYMNVIHAAQSYLQISPNFVKRKRREELLDAAVTMLQTNQLPDGKQHMETYLALLACYCVLPHGNSRLLQDGGAAIRAMATQIDVAALVVSQDDVSCLGSMYAIILGSVMKQSEQAGMEQSWRYRESFFEHVREVVKSRKELALLPGTLQIVKVFLEVVAPQLVVEKPGMVEQITDTRTGLLRKVHQELVHLKGEGDLSASSTIPIVSSLANVLSCYRANDSINDLGRKILRQALDLCQELWQGVTKNADVASMAVLDPETLTLETQRSVGLSHTPPEKQEQQQTPEQLGKTTTFEALRLRNQSFKATWKTLIPEARQKMSSMLVGQINNSTHTIGALRLLGMWLECTLSKETTPPKSVDTDELRQNVNNDLATVLVTLCNKLQTSNDMRIFRLVTDNILLILRSTVRLSPTFPKRPSLTPNQRHALSQSSIEALIQSLTTTTSPSGPRLPTLSSPTILTRLLLITQVTLVTHRRRLRGRHHLLAPILTHLLRLLFTPNPHARASRNLIPQPPWLSASTCTPVHATALSRLLTTTCDPSASSTRRGPRSAANALTDETRAARAHAGRYMPLVLADFCHCQLHGRIAPEVRAALRPGLHAAFACVEAGVLEAANARLGAPARSVFKALYEDYKRFGRARATT